MTATTGYQTLTLTGPVPYTHLNLPTNKTVKTPDGNVDSKLKHSN